MRRRRGDRARRRERDRSVRPEEIVLMELFGDPINGVRDGHAHSPAAGHGRYARYLLDQDGGRQSQGLQRVGPGVADRYRKRDGGRRARRLGGRGAPRTSGRVAAEQELPGQRDESDTRAGPCQVLVHGPSRPASVSPRKSTGDNWSPPSVICPGSVLPAATERCQTGVNETTFETSPWAMAFDRVAWRPGPSFGARAAPCALARGVLPRRGTPWQPQGRRGRDAARPRPDKEISQLPHETAARETSLDGT